MYPLNMVDRGKDVEVLRINGGLGMSQRLGRMGIYPGTRIKVINSSSTGPVLVAMGDKRFGLGFGMSHRIFVKPL